MYKNKIKKLQSKAKVNLNKKTKLTATFVKIIGVMCLCGGYSISNAAVTNVIIKPGVYSFWAGGQSTGNQMPLGQDKGQIQMLFCVHGRNDSGSYSPFGTSCNGKHHNIGLMLNTQPGFTMPATSIALNFEDTHKGFVTCPLFETGLPGASGGTSAAIYSSIYAYQQCATAQGWPPNYFGGGNNPYHLQVSIPEPLLLQIPSNDPLYVSDNLYLDMGVYYYDGYKTYIFNLDVSKLGRIRKTYQTCHWSTNNNMVWNMPDQTAGSAIPITLRKQLTMNCDPIMNPDGTKDLNPATNKGLINVDTYMMYSNSAQDAGGNYCGMLDKDNMPSYPTNDSPLLNIVFKGAVGGKAVTIPIPCDAFDISVPNYTDKGPLLFNTSDLAPLGQWYTGKYLKQTLNFDASIKIGANVKPGDWHQTLQITSFYK